VFDGLISSSYACSSFDVHSMLTKYGNSAESPLSNVHYINNNVTEDQITDYKHREEAKELLKRQRKLRKVSFALPLALSFSQVLGYRKCFLWVYFLQMSIYRYFWVGLFCQTNFFDACNCWVRLSIGLFINLEFLFRFCHGLLPCYLCGTFNVSSEWRY
jgi:hypothetical protein